MFEQNEFNLYKVSQVFKENTVSILGDIKDDEPEVTMTDLEKALGLDRARQEYAADALAAASKAFFEGKGFGAIADAAAVKSKAPDIKRLAGLEEFKMKGAKEIAKTKLFETGVLTEKLEAKQKETPYSRYGNYLNYIFIIFGVIVFGKKFIRPTD